MTAHANSHTHCQVAQTNAQPKSKDSKPNQPISLLFRQKLK